MAETHGSVLERTETAPTVAPTDNGDHDRFAHYVPKKQLEAAIFTGTPTLALCGKLWLPSADPKKFPVCPTCREVYEQMQAGDTDSPDYGK